MRAKLIVLIFILANLSVGLPNRSSYAQGIYLAPGQSAQMLGMGMTLHKNDGTTSIFCGTSIKAYLDLSAGYSISIPDNMGPSAKTVGLQMMLHPAKDWEDSHATFTLLGGMDILVAKEDRDQGKFGFSFGALLSSQMVETKKSKIVPEAGVIVAIPTGDYEETHTFAVVGFSLVQIVKKQHQFVSNFDYYFSKNYNIISFELGYIINIHTP